MSARVRRADDAKRQAEAIFFFFFLTASLQSAFVFVFCCECVFFGISFFEVRTQYGSRNMYPGCQISLPRSRVVHSIMEECCMLACFTHIQPKWEINISDSGCFRCIAADQKPTPPTPPAAKPQPPLLPSTATTPLPPIPRSTPPASIPVLDCAVPSIPRFQLTGHFIRYILQVAVTM